MRTAESIFVRTARAGSSTWCIREGEHIMEHVETCFLCGKQDTPRNLGLWLVNSERRTVHVACWIAARETSNGDTKTAA